MNKTGAQELSMSVLSPLAMWEASGRDKTLEPIMLKVKDRKGRDLCLGPTHEEEVTQIAAAFLSSYKQLPFTLYQIQTKFRDEPRPRFGLVRGCEFLMKDAYSFDVDEAGLKIAYEAMRAAYEDIFKECGLNIVMTAADSGPMGGSVSHEFMVEAPIGEDALWFCQTCSKYYREQGDCPTCKKALVEKKMTELGHIFQLGTKYSAALSAMFVDKDGTRKPAVMGCYGIGVSRILAAIVEQSYDDKGIIWPKRVSPYDLSLVVLDDSLLAQALELSDELAGVGLTVLVDDRIAGAGVKFNDAYLIGNPFIAIMGKNYIACGKLDLEIRKTREKRSLSRQELVNFLREEFNG
jgi:prolyl-tRNA synthetase